MILNMFYSNYFLLVAIILLVASFIPAHYFHSSGNVLTLLPVSSHLILTISLLVYSWNIQDTVFSLKETHLLRNRAVNPGILIPESVLLITVLYQQTGISSE